MINIYNKTNTLQNNIDWENIYEQNTQVFIPPIQYGKVIKVHTGDMFIIATKMPFMNETIENAKIYRFNIYLDSISAPKIITIMNVENDIGIKSREALSNLIMNRVIELRDITSDTHGKLYSNVFVDNIHVNDWLLKHNFAIKCENGKKRRVTESDSQIKSIKQILPNNNIEKVLEYSSKYFPSKKQNNYILPIIQQKNRPISSSSTIQTDCFLSHNWGEKHKNHEMVSEVNMALKKRGLNTWFDENKIDGNIRYKMAEGIDNTKCVVVFITKEYRDKVNNMDMKDNCKYEFTYAMNQLGSQNMVSVIMEPEMKETNKWKGELGAALGSMLFVDFSSLSLSEIELEKKYDELYKRIKHRMHTKR